MAYRILRLGLAALALLLCLGTALSAAATRPAAMIGSTASLDRALSKDLRQAGGASSALVVDATTGQTLFSSSPNTARLPASVEKLFTTSAALFEFGSNGRFQTSVLGVGTMSHGVFSGKLYLKGGGDPTFGDAQFDARLYGDRFQRPVAAGRPARPGRHPDQGLDHR